MKSTNSKVKSSPNNTLSIGGAKSKAVVQTLAHAAPHHAFELDKYVVAAMTAAVIYGAITLYQYARIGSVVSAQFSSTTALTSTILLGLILLIGTGSRLFSYPDRFLRYRKQLGIMAMIVGLSHGFIWFFRMKGTMGERLAYIATHPSFGPGLGAAIVLFFLFLISRRPITKFLGTALWWKLQYWGLRTTFVLIAIHMFVLKGERWLSWYQQPQTTLPPEGLLIGWFVIFVILVRLSELLGAAFAKKAWYILGIGLICAYAMTFL